MASHVNGGLRSPAYWRALERSEELLGKLNVLAKIVVTKVYVPAACRLDVPNNLIDRPLSIQAVIDRGD